MYEYVIMAPGQGVQRPGMLDPWLEASPGASDLLSGWSDAVGFDMLDASRDEALLGDTSVAQPLIVAAALLSMDRLQSRIAMADHRTLFAGHSVGELAASVGAGYLAPGTAITLARARGTAMSAACALNRSGMAAVMPTKAEGASDESISAAIRAAGLTLANWNGSHQFVAAGPVDCLEAFASSQPLGMRIAPLDVAGAFHTDAMTAAKETFSQAVNESQFLEPTSPMLGNRDGMIVAGPDDLRLRLVAQITSAVRWDRCTATIASFHAPDTVYIELAPAGPLTRLIERAHPGLRTVALRGPQDVDRVRSVAEPAAGVVAAVRHLG